MEKPPLVPPPRAIPSSLRWRVQLGGLLPTIAFALLAFGGFMATVFVSNSELATWYRFATELGTTEGTALHSENTNMQLNSSTVVLVEFGYRVNGDDFVGQSFCQGRIPEDDETVLVEYALNNPETSRIEGMRSAPFPATTAFILIVPFAAIVLLAVGYIRGRRRVELMQNGTSAWGLLTNREPTNTRINNQRVHKLTFTFLDEAGREQTATDRSHKSEFFDDQIARHVLKGPGRCCIVELLPGSPKIVDEQWAPVRGISRARVFILPIVAIVVIALASQVTF